MYGLDPNTVVILSFYLIAPASSFFRHAMNPDSSGLRNQERTHLGVIFQPEHTILGYFLTTANSNSDYFPTSPSSSIFYIISAEVALGLLTQYHPISNLLYIYYIFSRLQVVVAELFPFKKRAQDVQLRDSHLPP